MVVALAVEGLAQVMSELRTQSLLIQIRLRQLFFYFVLSWGHKCIKKSELTKQIYLIGVKNIYEMSKNIDEMRFFDLFRLTYVNNTNIQIVINIKLIPHF